MPSSDLLEPKLTGVCEGGPRDGQVLRDHCPVVQVIVPVPSELGISSYPGPEATLARIGTYRFEAWEGAPNKWIWEEGKAE
jgi:hypothetical protein